MIQQEVLLAVENMPPETLDELLLVVKSKLAKHEAIQQALATIKNIVDEVGLTLGQVATSVFNAEVEAPKQRRLKAIGPDGQEYRGGRPPEWITNATEEQLVEYYKAAGHVYVPKPKDADSASA